MISILRIGAITLEVRILILKIAIKLNIPKSTIAKYIKEKDIEDLNNEMSTENPEIVEP